MLLLLNAVLKSAWARINTISAWSTMWKIEEKNLQAFSYGVNDFIINILNLDVDLVILTFRMLSR